MRIDTNWPTLCRGCRGHVSLHVGQMIATKLLVGYLNCGGLGSRNPHTMLQNSGLYRTCFLENLPRWNLPIFSFRDHPLHSLKNGSHLLTFLWQEVCPQYANKPDLHDVTWFFCWSFLNDDDGSRVRPLERFWRDLLGNWRTREFLHFGEKMIQIDYMIFFRWVGSTTNIERVIDTTNDINDDGTSRIFPSCEKVAKPTWLAPCLWSLF